MPFSSALLIAALAPVRDAWVRGAPVLALDEAVERIVWANAAGASLLGTDVAGTLDAAIGRTVAKRQITAALRGRGMGAAARVSVRLTAGFGAPLASVSVQRQSLSNGDIVTLLIGPTAEVAPDPETILSALAPHGEAALLDGSERIVAQTPGFTLPNPDTPRNVRIALGNAHTVNLAIKGLDAHAIRLQGDPLLAALLIARDQAVDAEAVQTPGDAAPSKSADEAIAEEASAETPPQSDPADPIIPPEALGPSVPSFSDGPAPDITAPDAFEGESNTILPTRFVWRSDANGAFTDVSPELLRAVEIERDAIVGRDATGLDRIVHADRDRLGNALADDAAFTHRTVAWAVPRVGVRVPVAFSGVPQFDGSRFLGHRGHGKVRLADAVIDAELDADAGEPETEPNGEGELSAAEREAFAEIASVLNRDAEPNTANRDISTVTDGGNAAPTSQAFDAAENSVPNDEQSAIPNEGSIADRDEPTIASEPVDAPTSHRDPSPADPDIRTTQTKPSSGDDATGFSGEHVGAETRDNDAALPVAASPLAAEPSISAAVSVEADTPTPVADISASDTSTEFEENGSGQPSSETVHTRSDAPSEPMSRLMRGRRAAASPLRSAPQSQRIAGIRPGLRTRTRIVAPDAPTSLRTPAPVADVDASPKLLTNASETVDLRQIAPDSIEPSAGLPGGNSRADNGPHPASGVRAVLRERADPADRPVSAAQAERDPARDEKNEPVGVAAGNGEPIAAKAEPRSSTAERPNDGAKLTVPKPSIRVRGNGRASGAGNAPFAERFARVRQRPTVSTGSAGSKSSQGSGSGASRRDATFESVRNTTPIEAGSGKPSAASKPNGRQSPRDFERDLESIAAISRLDEPLAPEPSGSDPSATQPIPAPKTPDEKVAAVAERGSRFAERDLPNGTGTEERLPDVRPTQVMPSVEAPGADAPSMERPSFVAEAQTSPDEAQPSVNDPAPFGDEPKSGVDTTWLDRLPVPVLVQSARELLYANPAFAELTGYDNLDALRDAGGLDALFDEAPAGDEGTVALQTRDGDRRAVSAKMQSVPWNDADGAGDGSALLITLRPFGQGDGEITPGPEPIDDRLNTLNRILDEATDGVVFLDGKGHIRALSRRAANLLGYRDEDVEGRAFAMLFAAQSRDDASSLVNTMVEGPVRRTGVELTAQTAVDDEVPLFVTVGAMRDRGGFCAVLRDLSEWRQTEFALREAREEAEAASREKSRFLTRVSHEIRTPLNAIIGFAEVMTEERFGPVGNDRYREYLSDIRTSGRHVLDLVNDLLDIAKIEAGRNDIAFEAVDLNEELLSATQMMGPQADEARVIVRTALGPIPPVVADRRSIKQIALNVLSNAVRYTDPGGQVIVSTKAVDGGVTLRVRDTGIGMSQDDIDRALEPFTQVPARSESMARRASTGTGLGLPLTKAMAESNRAEFSISSVRGRGTLVELHFPEDRVLR